MLLLLFPSAARVSLALGTSGAPAANSAAKMFEKQCYSCHNIGGADKKGPDLKNVLKRQNRAWLHRFIGSASTVKNSGDPEAGRLFKKYAPEEMPDQMLSEEQVDQLLSLIDEYSKKNKLFIPTSGRLSRRPTPHDIPIGHRLFTGQTLLANGGPPCISCHSVAGVGAMGGGALGPDLTHQRRRYSEVELASMLKAPAFPTMSKVFTDHVLTNEEVVQLYAYLDDVKSRTPETRDSASRYVASSAAGVLVLFGGMSFVWRGRMRGVRRSIVRR